MTRPFRAGFVGIVGLPNAGKSTLINQLVGQKVAIVSSKPQSTRKRVIGVCNRKNGQVLFVDAPGYVGSSVRGLNRFLSAENEDVIQQSDTLAVVLNIDVGSPEQFDGILQLVRDSGKSWIAIINKVDLGRPHRVRLLKERLKGVRVFELSGKNLTSEDSAFLLDALLENLPESPEPLYDSELYTTQSLRDLTSEIVREKAFEALYDEIPYGLAVRIRSFDEVSAPFIKIDAEIVLAKENHKAIVIGEAGKMLKRIGSESRAEIEKVSGQKVFLQTHVVVRKNWLKNLNHLKSFGYVVAKS